MSCHCLWRATVEPGFDRNSSENSSEDFRTDFRRPLLWFTVWTVHHETFCIGKENTRHHKTHHFHHFYPNSFYYKHSICLLFFFNYESFFSYTGFREHIFFASEFAYVPQDLSGSEGKVSGIWVLGLSLCRVFQTNCVIFTAKIQFHKYRVAKKKFR